MYVVSEVTLTNTLVAYSAGDVIGQLFKLDKIGYAKTRAVKLASLFITDKENLKPAGTIYLFGKKIASPAADNAAFTIADTEVGNIVCRIPVAAGDWLSVGTDFATAIIPKSVLDQVMLPFAGGALYGQFVATGTPDYNTYTDALVLRFGFVLNDTVIAL